jgi:hypothetical protein
VGNPLRSQNAAKIVSAEIIYQVELLRAKQAMVFNPFSEKSRFVLKHCGDAEFVIVSTQADRLPLHRVSSNNQIWPVCL